MMNDLAKRPREEQSGSREVEEMLTRHAGPAQSFDSRGRLTAFRAERRYERNQAGPAFRTCSSPFALLNRSVTIHTRDWEQEIEDVVEQSAFGGNAKGKVNIPKTKMGS